MLYTVVMDYRSGTYISQVKARSVETALRVWTEHLDISGVAGLGRRRKAELIGEIKKQVSRREAPTFGRRGEYMVRVRRYVRWADNIIVSARRGEF